jgi:hypothetical protein
MSAGEGSLLVPASLLLEEAKTGEEPVGHRIEVSGEGGDLLRKPFGSTHGDIVHLSGFEGKRDPGDYADTWPGTDCRAIHAA